MPKETKSKFTKKDFKDFRFEKIIGISDSTRVLRLYPQLEKYPEFKESNYKDAKKRLSFDKVLKYALIMYSDTIINQTIQELPKRKYESALLAGFEINEETETFSGIVETLLKCEDDYWNSMLARVITISRNNKFQELCAFNEARRKEMEAFIKGGGKTIEQMKALREMTDYIDDLERELLNKDDSIDLLEELYSEVDANNLGIRPEEVAKSRKEGTFEKIIKDPYK